MTIEDISRLRLQNQQIENSEFLDTQNLVHWMGAIQAQDYEMAKWAIGIRMPNATNNDIEEAVRKGEIIRTHLLRPTWHFVASTDIYWMLQLTSPHIKSSVKSRHKNLNLNKQDINKCKTLIEKLLSDGNHLTREEICIHLENARVSTIGQRAPHLLMMCELDGIICSGIPKGKKQTYALLEERVPKPPELARDQSLAELALRYFTSHGPATIQDFIWWSGLPVRDAKNALESIKTELEPMTTNQQTYWLNRSNRNKKPNTKNIFLLPAYDEFIISYKDRTPSIRYENQKKAISDNGLFRPIIVQDGIILGTWRKTQKKDKVIIETNYFANEFEPTNKVPEQSARNYGDFLQQKTELVNIGV